MIIILGPRFDWLSNIRSMAFIKTITAQKSILLVVKTAFSRVFSIKFKLVARVIWIQNSEAKWNAKGTNLQQIMPLHFVHLKTWIIDTLLETTNSAIFCHMIPYYRKGGPFSPYGRKSLSRFYGDWGKFSFSGNWRRVTANSEEHPAIWWTFIFDWLFSLTMLIHCGLITEFCFLGSKWKTLGYYP